MSQSQVGRVADAPTGDARWIWLYRIGTVAALVSIVIIPVSIAGFFLWPLWPDNILVVIQEDWLAGLMGLDFLYLLGNIVAIPFFPVLYVTLKEVDESWALIALTLGLIGLVCLVPARPIPEMFALSDRHAAASTDAEREMIVASGEAMLTHFHGMAYNAHYVLGSLSLLISSLLMLRSDLFGRVTAYVGIATNIVVFGLYVPAVGVYISMLSVVGYVIWYFLIARRLFRLGWRRPGEQAH